jgi:adenosylcobinamide kinase/adenosylcobinamide-phosphate guanylyltransferase
MALTFIIGGARSGKSDLAQRIAAASGRPVIFVATMQPEDAELRARVEVHRAGRPASWRTLEAPLDPLAALRADARAGDVIVLDCLTLWVSNLLLANVADVDNPTAAEAADALDLITTRARALVDWVVSFDGEVAAVSNEVGSGVVPAYPLGRIYRDALGSANNIAARSADRVYHVVAGLALELKSLGARPLDAFGGDPRA